jgi:hypothetical protein
MNITFRTTVLTLPQVQKLLSLASTDDRNAKNAFNASSMYASKVHNRLDVD